MNGTVVVLGGGFAGFWAALAARRVGGDAVDVRLVSRTPDLGMRPRFYEADPASLAIDLRAPLGKAGIGFVEGEALSVDDTTLNLADGRTLPFDRLVLATGSVMSRPPLPGAEQAWSIDTRAEAMAFDRRLEDLALQVEPGHVVVVGAGFTGIELALELRDRLAVHGGDGEALRISLVDRADVVGPELGEGPRPVIEAALAKGRVDLRLGETVTAMSAVHVDTARGRIEADAVVLCTGLRAAPFTRGVGGPRDRLGRLEVGSDLRAPASSAVFAAGDAAAVDTGDGYVALQSCQHALQTGRFAGENAARDLLGLPLMAYRQPRYVTCLDLGRAGAVFTQGWDRTVAMHGAEAKALKRRINREVIYPPHDADARTLLALSSTDPALQVPAAVATT
ncbi:MAG: FAD-dependent oxidoreductase [Pseudomonadota bacterium]|nr:FAD-dependent oxidoreductase [Pseudomonadota bacterium]